MWTTIDPRNLKVGHHVRIEHGWLSHPFPRSTFTISSQRDLDLIRQHGLKRISFDPGRSELADENLIIGAEPAGNAEPVVAAQPTAPVEEPTRVKQRMVQEVQGRRQRLETLSRDFVRESRDAAEALRLIDAGDTGGFQMMSTLAAKAVAISGSDDAALCFVGTSLAPAALDGDSAMAVSAMALASELGRKLMLDEALSRDVAVAAALRTIGLRRFPPHERSRPTTGALPANSPLRNYPKLSAEILGRSARIPESVLLMVEQHRECLDGSGFPQGLRGDAILPGALLVGLIHEYQELTSPGRQPRQLSPSDAIRHLYQARRDQFGIPLMMQFIATLSVYPPGTFVRLSDDSTALVVRVNTEHRLRPVVLVLDSRESLAEGDIQDLSRNQDLSIVSAFPAGELPPLAIACAGLTDIIGMKVDKAAEPGAH